MIDDTVEVGPWRYESLIAMVEEKLASAPRGFRVATYYGFGGALPKSYLRQALPNVDRLEFFVKT
jgi:hypothetical protein